MRAFLGDNSAQDVKITESVFEFSTNIKQVYLQLVRDKKEKALWRPTFGPKLGESWRSENGRWPANWVGHIAMEARHNRHRSCIFIFIGLSCTFFVVRSSPAFFITFPISRNIGSRLFGFFHSILWGPYLLSAFSSFPLFHCLYLLFAFRLLELQMWARRCVLSSSSLPLVLFCLSLDCIVPIFCRRSRQFTPSFKSVTFAVYKKQRRQEGAIFAKSKKKLWRTRTTPYRLSQIASLLVKRDEPHGVIHIL